jgi:hypothetical protein
LGVTRDSRYLTACTTGDKHLQFSQFCSVPVKLDENASPEESFTSKLKCVKRKTMTELE